MHASLRWLLDQRAQPLSPAMRNAVVAFAVIGLGAAAVWAWRAGGLEAGDIRWTPVILSFLIGGPASIAMKAAGFVVSARIVGQRPSLTRSVHVAVVSSAANLLPLPGSLIVTVRSLSEDGSTYAKALAAGALPGLAWIAFAGIVGGAAIGAEGALWLSAIVVACGLGAAIGAARIFGRIAPAEGRTGLAVQLIAAQAGWLVVSALRLGLAMKALGIPVAATQAIALSVAGATTAAVGFVPGGLGLREALIAGLAPIVGLPLELGVLIGTVDRVAWFAFLAVAAGALALANTFSARPTGPEESDGETADQLG